MITFCAVSYSFQNILFGPLRHYDMKILQLEPLENWKEWVSFQKLKSFAWNL